jgi:hypothetical protein
MVVTTRVRLDRIASSTRNAGLSPEVIVGDDIIASEGYVLAVRILADKSSYNTVEDVTGRMLELRAGDVLAGVLGTRRALRGYAGVVPAHIGVGDTIDVLNLGGILGQCTSMNPDIGPPFRAEVLGAILAFPALGDRVGRPAHIRDHAVPTADTLERFVPVVYVAGTCMNAGKTIAATELVRGLTRGGLRVAAAKLTGVSLMRDALSMLDAGAVAALTFNDVGIASTHPGVTVTTAKGIFNRLAAAKPDVIVAQLGDGILGEYGVRHGGSRSGGVLGCRGADAESLRAADHGDYGTSHRQRGRSALHPVGPRSAGPQCEEGCGRVAESGQEGDRRLGRQSSVIRRQSDSYVDRRITPYGWGDCVTGDWRLTTRES